MILNKDIGFWNWLLIKLQVKNELRILREVKVDHVALNPGGQLGIGGVVGKTEFKYPWKWPWKK